MVVSPTGRILYLSKSFPGIEIEWGLADAGFDGLIQAGRRVGVPTANAEWHKELSSVRIIVEQRFRNIKVFRATKEQLRGNLALNRNRMLQNHHEVWTIAAVLCNDFATSDMVLQELKEQ